MKARLYGSESRQGKLKDFEVVDSLPEKGDAVNFGMVHRDVRKIRIFLQRLIASQDTRKHSFKGRETSPERRNTI